jgi:hypothetical protein
MKQAHNSGLGLIVFHRSGDDLTILRAKVADFFGHNAKGVRPSVQNYSLEKKIGRKPFVSGGQKAIIPCKCS